MTGDAPGLGNDQAGFIRPETPCRVRRSRAKGFRLPPDTVIVDRSTRWGNPFVVKLNLRHSIYRMQIQQLVEVERFRCMLLNSGRWTIPATRKFACIETTVEDVKRYLAGRNLACWCHHDTPCHADVLLEIANGWPCPSRLPKYEPGPAMQEAIRQMQQIGKGKTR